MANRDEQQYPDLDTSDIGRRTNGHLGFRGGVHRCLGTTISRMSVKIATQAFHDVVPEYVRVHDELPWTPSSTFRSPMRLELARA